MARFRAQRLPVLVILDISKMAVVVLEGCTERSRLLMDLGKKSTGYIVNCLRVLGRDFSLCVPTVSEKVRE